MVCLAIWCTHTTSVNAMPINTNTQTSLSSIISNQLPSIPGVKPEVLRLAIRAYNNARAKGIGEKDILTVVDYSMPSTEKRLWVIDMRTQTVLFNTHVSHGMGSGNNYATKFSNKHGSRQSSLGLYLTADTYYGNHGHSLNLIGLEEKYNSNAKARRIVFHQAHYVDETVIKKIGRLGRSFGCLALSTKIATKVMNTIKDGSLVFCYYPDSNWLKESKFL